MPELGALGLSAQAPADSSPGRSTWPGQFSGTGRRGWAPGKAELPPGSTSDFSEVVSHPFSQIAKWKQYPHMFTFFGRLRD